MKSTTYYYKRKFLFIPVMILLIAVLSAVIMAIWNIIMTVIFNLPAINFWQAVGIFIMAKILFGGFRNFGVWHHYPWKYNLRDKLSKMTPEEKETFFKNLHSYRKHCYHESYKEDNNKNKEEK